MRNYKWYILLLFLAAGMISSCSTYKNVAYFSDLPDTARAAILNAHYEQLVIHPDDILSINIQTLDPVANQMFGMAQGSAASGGASGGASAGGGSPAAIPGYLVDKAGDVELPMLGTFHLAGMTTNQARDTIQKTAAGFFKNPVAYVRFANLKVTVLGEVGRPGTFILPNEKNTIFDALGMAGDLTIFGKRENVLLIRDSLGYSTLTRFSLSSKDIFQKDFYFLKQNDVIYIEPNQSKVVSQDAIKTRNFALIASAITLLIVVVSRINF